MKISMSATRLNNSHLKLVYSISNVIFAFLLIAPLSSWGAACDLSVNSEEGLRSALVSCQSQGGGTIHLDADISASQGEFSYMSYNDGGLKVDGNGHSISVPEGSEWRILKFGGMGLLTLENITLANGTALGLGGAVYVPQGSITVIDSVLTGNRVVDNPNGNGDECAGGAIYGPGPIRVVRSRIIGNQAGRPLPAWNISCGGGAIAGGSVAITDSTLSENSAGNINNQTSGNGGAVLCWGPCLIADSIIINNASYFGYGGGIYAHRDLTINNSTIKDNKAFGNRNGGGGGGGIYSASRNLENVIITQSTISGNQSSAEGGGISSLGPVEINNSIARVGTVEINNSIVRENVSAQNGGGISSSSVRLIITESIITENKAGARGGGTFSLGEILINTSTIMDNSAKARGGGAYVFNPEASLSINYKNTINNSTITRNRARDGGGIATDSESPGKISMNFTTISSNYSSVGAANLSSSFSVLLKGSVITDPLGSRRNCSSKVTASSSYSIEGSSVNSCGLNRGQGNKRAPVSAIALGALGDNGGPTPTMLPSSSSILFTSAAPDGLGSGIIEDQRLFNRSGPFTIGSVQLLSHEITPYVFEGFFKPVSNINWNNITLKSIVPVRWRLSDSKSGRLITDPASVTSKTYIRIDCSSGLDYPGATEKQATGAAVVWKKASRRFEFKWKPPFAVGECMRLDFKFSDNQTHSAKFFIMKPN